MALPAFPMYHLSAARSRRGYRGRPAMEMFTVEDELPLTKPYASGAMTVQIKLEWARTDYMSSSGSGLSSSVQTTSIEASPRYRESHNRLDPTLCLF